MNIKLGALVGWGIVIYATTYLMSQLVAARGFGGLLGVTLVFATLISTAVVAGRSLGFRHVGDIAPYALAWVLEIILLDYLLIYPYAGINLYMHWQLWAGYLIAGIIPLLTPFTHDRHFGDV